MDKTPPRKVKIEEKPIKEVDQFVWNVPICCREGWDNCPHVVKRQNKKIKNNIGL